MLHTLPTLHPASLDRPMEIPLEPLTPASFATFGTVITTPFPSVPEGTKAPLQLSTPPKPRHPNHQVQAIFANQKSALKTAPISTFENAYPDQLPSKNVDRSVLASAAASRPLMSMFTCFSREISSGHFPVKILERHPCTTQTFIPLGLPPSSPKNGESDTKFLVVVAPSKSGLENGIHNGPDLSKLRAFEAEGNMAVTYGVGTWHAPMVVVGEDKVDFVVVQFVDGTSRDCEEVLIGGDVRVDTSILFDQKENFGMWTKSKSPIRAKL